MANRFTAEFDSECEGCGDEIQEGDTAGYVGSEIVCETCCDEDDEKWDL
jgi:hypothetical protein